MSSAREITKAWSCSCSIRQTRIFTSACTVTSLEINSPKSWKRFQRSTLRRVFTFEISRNHMMRIPKKRHVLAGLAFTAALSVPPLLTYAQQSGGRKIEVLFFGNEGDV